MNSFQVLNKHGLPDGRPASDGDGELPSAEDVAGGGIQALRRVSVQMYTDTCRVEGFLASLHWRVSDTLNAVDQEYLLVHNATMSKLDEPDHPVLTDTDALIRIDTIRLVLPDSSLGQGEESPLHKALVVTKDVRRIKAEVAPFTVEGQVHLSPGADLLQFVHHFHRRFIPVTEVTVSRLSGGPQMMAVPFILLNRELLQIAVPIKDAGAVTCAQGQDQQLSLAGALDEDTVAKLLASTAIFRGLDVTELKEICGHQAQAGVISRRRYRAGDAILEQGDDSDTFFVIESGYASVTLETASGALKPSYLGPREVFGEIGVLGGQGRIAAVTSSTDVSVIAFKEPALRTLMQRFPRTATRLLSLMMERLGSLPYAVPVASA